MNGIDMAIYTIDDSNIIIARSETPADGTVGARFDSQKNQGSSST